VALEPGDMIRCKSDWDGATLADILSERGINWDYVYEKDGKEGLWVIVLPEEETP
jgi:hypothetical protein